MGRSPATRPLLGFRFSGWESPFCLASRRAEGEAGAEVAASGTTIVSIKVGGVGESPRSHWWICPSGTKTPKSAPTETTLPAAFAMGWICKIPESRASMSWVAFSPSRENKGSPARTESPSALSHPAKVPSSMDQPNRGTRISKAMFIPPKGIGLLG